MQQIKLDLSAFFENETRTRNNGTKHLPSTRDLELERFVPFGEQITVDRLRPPLHATDAKDRHRVGGIGGDVLGDQVMSLRTTGSMHEIEKERKNKTSEGKA